MVNKVLFYLYLFLIFNSLLNNAYGSIINQEGDYIFSYFSDLVYKPKSIDTNEKSKNHQFLQINGECVEWNTIVDEGRMMIFKSKLSNNLIISFKGTQGFKDLLVDINFRLFNCFVGFGGKKSCGKIHFGFQEQYFQIYEKLESTIRSLDQPYDIFFCGHSLGGAIALIASLDFSVNHKEFKFKHSVNCITFGQPGVGNYEFNQYLLSNINKFIYRRYVNINNHTALSIDETLYRKNDFDPISESLFSHVIEPIYLNCKRIHCPIFSLGLHHLDLYMSNLYNKQYSECNSNCNFYEKNAKFMKFRSYHCQIKNESYLKGYFNPTGALPDNYSVCLFNSHEQYNEYDFKRLKNCHIKNKKYGSPHLLINKEESKKLIFERITNASDAILVVENHNLILGTSSFEYNISFSNPLPRPLPPTNITSKILFINNNEMDILVNFDHYNDNNYYNNTNYFIYLSSIGNNWIKTKVDIKNCLKFSNLKKQSIETVLKGIPKGYYSLVTTALDISGIESDVSNIIFVGNT